MRVRWIVGILWIGAALSVARTTSAQEWTGKGRVEGSVVNTKGEPIAGAAISLRWEESGHGGPDVKTDKKGKWAYFGLTGGEWTCSVEAPGYVPQKFSVHVAQGARNQPIDVKLEPEAKAEEAHQELRVGGKTISKEASEAIERANAAFTAKNLPEARENYLRALQELPDMEPLLMRLAAVYAAENNTPEALKYARQASEKDPNDIYAWLLIATIEMQNGNLDAGKAALDKVPPEKVTQPEVFMNMGIVLYNKKKPAEAEVAFDKALALSPDLADGYYYRGLARLQQGHKTEAKADLRKYLELAPNGSESKDVKAILGSMP